MEVHVLYKEFRDRSAAASVIVRYLETLLKFANTLKNLILADREENWIDHLQAIQDMRPVFCHRYLPSLSWNDAKISKNTPQHI